ncbi:hypothetical protein DPEC_G00208720 [Dallia pectoralis]|uniref:Uncharacterized protein n=1 Tax=Dallia pectoralis TaxID=75939 RepID=A0ACC2G4W9_DALPE|nr:hypothetical protein DPEC_G00208720 [Dallia pectoralis]
MRWYALDHWQFVFFFTHSHSFSLPLEGRIAPVEVLGNREGKNVQNRENSHLENAKRQWPSLTMERLTIFQTRENSH